MISVTNHQHRDWRSSPFNALNWLHNLVFQARASWVHLSQHPYCHTKTMNSYITTGLSLSILGMAPTISTMYEVLTDSASSLLWFHVPPTPICPSSWCLNSCQSLITNFPAFFKQVVSYSSSNINHLFQGTNTGFKIISKILGKKFKALQDLVLPSSCSQFGILIFQECQTNFTN